MVLRRGVKCHSKLGVIREPIKSRYHDGLPPSPFKSTTMFEHIRRHACCGKVLSDGEVKEADVTLSSRFKRR